MCHFLTIAIPAPKAALLEQAIPRGLALAPVHNPSIARHLPADFRAYVLMSGMCSCDLYRAVGQDLDRLRTKYAKRGWSEAKIERAVEQARPETFVGLRPDVRDLLAGVAETGVSLAIVIHWYRAEITTERFAISDGGSVSADAIRSGEPRLAEDQLLFVKPARQTGRQRR